jgi:predicted metal-binding protein
MKVTMRKAFAAAESSSGIRAKECAEVFTSQIIFSPELLKSCESNMCGNYNRSWTCPPLCESLEQQREKILSYKTAFVFTTKHELEDSFDYEGMMSGKKLHNSLTEEFRNKLRAELLRKDFPSYGAGACPFCQNEDGSSNCSYPQPCTFPDKQMGSIEAAGINVSELSKAAGVAYNNGVNTVTYFSMVLF